MELRDLIVTPLVIMLVYAVAYVIRPWVTDEVTRRYFFPALTVRVAGALFLGFIYQFYYSGGDTYNFHTYGSRILWDAFMDSPDKGLRLFFNDGTDLGGGIYKYASRISLFRDPGSYAVIRLAFLFDLFTFSTYSATAVLFSILSFIGIWMFFLTFYRQYPHLHKQLAIASFFIPSVFFWGSGLLKDTVTLACLGVAVYQTYKIFIVRRFFIQHILLLSMALYGLYIIKIYIILAFLPAAIIWIFMVNFVKIRHMVLKIMLFPVTLSLALGLGGYAIVRASEDNPKYALDRIGETAQITAYDIGYYSGRNAGSGYSLGELDGSFQSMLLLAPQALNVSLFRPYLWEVRNPLMLLSAVESFILLIIVLRLMFVSNIHALKALIKPNVIFLLIFSLVFAFGVGVSTFNFGTLVRYKIPMLPFFFMALVLINDYANRSRKLAVLEETE